MLVQRVGAMKTTRLTFGFGYFPNTVKTWLVTKSEHFQKASRIFEGTGVKVTTKGRPYLGAPVGTREFIESFKVSQWVDELDTHASFAQTQPHAVHSAFTHGLTFEWSYLGRTKTAGYYFESEASRLS